MTDAILEEAYAAAQRDGRKVKMLVFTNPNNPTGTVSSEEEMRIVLAFCRRHNIHLVGEVREGSGGMGSAESRVDARRECVRQLREVHREGPQEG